MDKFRQSRKHSLQQKKQSKQSQQIPGNFSQLSPQKIQQSQPKSQQSPHSYNRQFGQSDTLLNKQVSTMRRFQQAQQKLRQKQAAYYHLADMYDKVSKQKQGIETSLLHQIDMYRNLIKQIQEKAEERLRKVQQAFKQQMERKMAQKQQQMAIMQAQKDQLQNFVNQLQKIGNDLQTKLAFTNQNLKNTQQQLKKTEQQKKQTQQKLQAVQQHAKAQNQRHQQIIDGLKQKIIQQQRQWRDKLDEAGKQKQRALKQQQKQFKQQVNKINQKHQIQKAERKQQLKNIQDGFQVQKTRLNQQIAAKQKAIQQHHKQSKQNTNKLNNAIRGYEQEIQTLASQKARLFQQVDKLNQQNTHINILMKQLQLNSGNEKKNLQAYIAKLKDDISYSQNNFLRERDRNVINYQDSTKQIVHLKKKLSTLQSENQHLKHQAGDSIALANQVRKLRDMLLESSYQLQKCKQQFLKISKQRDYMSIRLNQASYQVGSLKRIKNQRQEQARTWRDTYYMNRSRSIRR